MSFYHDDFYQFDFVLDQKLSWQNFESMVAPHEAKWKRRGRSAPKNQAKSKEKFSTSNHQYKDRETG